MAGNSCWQETFNPHHMERSTGLLQYPCNMAAGFSRANNPSESKVEETSLSFDTTSSALLNVQGDDTRNDYLGIRITEGCPGGWLYSPPSDDSHAKPTHPFPTSLKVSSHYSNSKYRMLTSQSGPGGEGGYLGVIP